MLAKRLLTKLGQRPKAQALLLFMAVSLVLCLPAILAADSIIGLDEPFGDRANSLWLQWAVYTGTAVENKIFAPIGMEIQLNYFNLVDVYLAAPLMAVFGWPGHYNWLVVLIALFNCVTAWGFARVTGAQPLIAMTIGVLFAVSFPYVNAIENGRVIQSITGVLPLACLGIWRLHDAPSFKSMLLATVGVGLAGWVYLYFGLAMAVISFYVSLVRWRSWRRTHWLIVYYGLSACIAWWLVRDLHDYYNAVRLSTNAFPEPSKMFQPMYFAQAGAVLDHSVPIGFLGWSSDASLPLLFSAAAAVGFWNAPRRSLLPLIVLFSILALGPYLKTDSGFIGQDDNGWIGSVPYLWMFEHIPLVNRMRWPERWLSVIAALLIPLAVRGLQRFSTAGFVVPVAVLIVFADAGLKGFWPLSHTPFDPPRCYLELKHQPDGLLLISPFVYSDRAIVYQPIHGKSIVNPIGSGYDEIKWLDHYHRFLNDLSFIRFVRRFDHPMVTMDTFSAPDITAAKDAGILYFAHHWDYFKEALDSPDVPKDHGEDERLARQKFISILGEPDCVDDKMAIWDFGD